MAQAGWTARPSNKIQYEQQTVCNENIVAGVLSLPFFKIMPARPRTRLWRLPPPFLMRDAVSASAAAGLPRRTLLLARVVELELPLAYRRLEHALPLLALLRVLRAVGLTDQIE